MKLTFLSKKRNLLKICKYIPSNLQFPMSFSQFQLPLYVRYIRFRKRFLATIKIVNFENFQKWLETHLSLPTLVLIYSEICVSRTSWDSRNAFPSSNFSFIWFILSLSFSFICLRMSFLCIKFISFRLAFFVWSISKSSCWTFAT